MFALRFGNSLPFPAPAENRPPPFPVKPPVGGNTSDTFATRARLPDRRRVVAFPGIVVHDAQNFPPSEIHDAQNFGESVVHDAQNFLPSEIHDAQNFPPSLDADLPHFGRFWHKTGPENARKTVMALLPAFRSVLAMTEQTPQDRDLGIPKMSEN